jgi:hypothetical protein
MIPAGITDAGYNGAEARSGSISLNTTEAVVLLWYRQIANATNKRSRATNIAR